MTFSQQFILELKFNLPKRIKLFLVEIEGELLI
ncbi:MAG: hypothetical protein ACI837_002106 [Crocinitomicaceae bacterium]